MQGVAVGLRNRLGLIKHLFQQGLLVQRVYITQRGNLLLAFYQPVQLAVNGPDMVGTVACLPDHYTLPRMASTNCNTVVIPWMVSIWAAGMPPVILLGVRMKWRIHSSSPPVSAKRARARRNNSKASSPCLLSGSSDVVVLRRLMAVRCMPSTAASSACFRPSCSAARSTALARTASGAGLGCCNAVMTKPPMG